MKKTFLSLFGIFIFIISINQGIKAQNTGDTTDLRKLFNLSLKDLMNVTVYTVSRTKMYIKQLPATAIVVTSDDIINNNYTTLVDVLKDLPGFKVSQPGSAECGELFLMRGLLGNYYTKILLNGMPLAPSVASGIPIGEQINMMNVEKIEVIYGPASALYGADAVAGVINIITYSPYENNTQYTMSLGERGYLYNNFYTSFNLGKKDKIKFNTYVLFNKRTDTDVKDGYKDVYNRERYPYAQNNNIQFKLGDFPARYESFGQQIIFKDFKLSYDYMHRQEFSSQGQRTDYYLYDDENATWGEVIQRILIQHSTNTEKFTFNSNLSYLRYRLENNSYFSSIMSNSNPDTYGYRNNAYKFQASDDILLDEYVVWNPKKHWEFLGGFSFQYSGAFPKTNDLENIFNVDDYSLFSTKKPAPDTLYGDFGYNPITYYNIAGYFQGIYSNDKITLMLGGRYDKHSEYKDCFNPRVAIQYNIFNSTFIKASYNMAYKAPNPYYSYHSLASASRSYPGYINYITVPNDKLNPEKFTAYEVGLKQLVTKNISLEIIGFHENIKDLISLKGGLSSYDLGYQETAHPSDKVSIYANDGDAETTIMGIENIIQLKNIVENIKLSTNFYLSYTKGKETFPAKIDPATGETIIDKIDNRRMVPEWMWKFKIYAYPLKDLYISVDNLYCSDWYARDINSVEDYKNPEKKIAGYYTMDFLMNYKIFNNLKIHFEIENVFDKKYAGIQAYDSYNLIYNPQPGRNFFIGITLVL